MTDKKKTNKAWAIVCEGELNWSMGRPEIYSTKCSANKEKRARVDKVVPVEIKLCQKIKRKQLKGRE